MFHGKPSGTGQWAHLNPKSNQSGEEAYEYIAFLAGFLANLKAFVDLN